MMQYVTFFKSPYTIPAITFANTLKIRLFTALRLLSLDYENLLKVLS